MENDIPLREHIESSNKYVRFESKFIKPYCRIHSPSYKNGNDFLYHNVTCVVMRITLRSHPNREVMSVYKFDFVNIEVLNSIPNIEKAQSIYLFKSLSDADIDLIKSTIKI